MITLGGFIATNEDDLICDLAQYYSIYDYTAYDATFIATLACGLPQQSRCIKAVTDQKLTLEQTLLSLITDRLSWLVWAKTKDGQKGRNKPESIYELLTKEKEYGSYTIEDLEAKIYGKRK